MHIEFTANDYVIKWPSPKVAVFFFLDNESIFL